MDEREDRIKAQAHALWEAEGKPHGRDRVHWDQAIQDVDAADAQPDAAEQDVIDSIDVVEMAKTPRKPRKR